MPRLPLHLFATVLISLTFLSGCATSLPPSYDLTDPGRVLDGPVLALAGEGDLVAAVNSDGLFIKRGDGPWAAQEVPGLKRFGRVTCMAVNEGAVYVGSDGEGLFILSDGTWEIRTSRYGGLPDDGVLSMAFDGIEEGLPGEALWVGTRKGVAAYRDGKWVNYSPDGEWLVAMTGRPVSGAGHVYVGPGFKLGRRGDDSKRFRPPVSAIAAGPDRVIFGNLDSGLAVVSEKAVAVLKIRDVKEFKHLRVERAVVWAGTDSGLLWGGLKGSAEGKPWPTNRTYSGWSGTLFGSRDTRDFEYRWKTVGYNTAAITGLERAGPDVWVAHRSSGGPRQRPGKLNRSVTEESQDNPISDVRRYLNISEYIARKQKFRYESYGLGTGMAGEPSALYLFQESGKVWVGTTKGLWELEAN